MAEEMTPQDYRYALMKRDEMRSGLASISPLADAMITLSSVGPAPPLDHLSESGEAQYAYKTGYPAFNAFTSALGSPAVTLPLLGIDGMPTGVQLIGALHSDWPLTGYAKWMNQFLEPVSL